MTTANTAVPGLDTAESWFAGMKADFLAIPARIRTDLQLADALNSQGSDNAATISGASSALAGLPGVVSTLNDAQTRWTAAVSQVSQIQSQLEQGASGTIAVAVQIVPLAGSVLALESELTSAEQAMNLIAQQALSPSQYQAWAASAPSASGLQSVVQIAKYAAIGAGLYFGAKLLGFIPKRRVA
jgi:hypothetical protein